MMGRRIITTKLETTTALKVDTYFDKVVKYIPGDIVGAWVAVSGLISSGTDIPKSTLLWIAFVIGLVLTAIWTWKQTAERVKPTAVTQILISMGAFIVWVFALGGPFSTLEFYRPLYGSLVLIFYTLFVALINPPEG
jgi:hypothetical protein